MRIATWNIHMAGHDKVPLLVDAIVALDADVTVLTEYTPNAAGLQQALGRRYRWVDSRPVGRQLGVAVISRLPRTKLKETDPCPPWAGLTAIDVDGTRIVGVYSPGKSSHIGDRNDIKRDWWDGLIGRCDRWRHTPTVIIGDFNNGIDEIDSPHPGAFVHSDRFAALAHQGFRDGFRSGTTPEHHQPAWSWWQSSGWRRLDHIFITDHLTAADAHYVTEVDGIVLTDSQDKRDKRRLSDHAALIATLGPT